MSGGTRDIRRRCVRLFKEVGVTLVSAGTHRGHLRFVVEHQGREIKLNIPGSPTDVDVCLLETRRKLLWKMQEPPHAK